MGHPQLNAAQQEGVLHRPCRTGIALPERNLPRLHAITFPLSDLPPPQRDEVPHISLALRARELHQRLARDQLVVHDVAQRPESRLPGIGEVHRALVLRQPALVPRELRVHLSDRRRDLHARRLGEQPDHVVPRRRRPRAAMPPHVVHRVIDDPCLPARLERARHLRADQPDPAHDERIDVRINRIQKGRHEQPRALGPHLVHVVEDLGEPFSVERVRHEPGLDLRHHEPVAIVVVPRVLVVDPRHLAALPLRAELRAVPFDDHLLAVGIHTRDENHHRVPELRLERVVRREPIRELESHLRRRYLVRVDVALDHEHRRLVRVVCRFVRALQDSRIRELSLRGKYFFAPANVLRRRDDRRKQWLTHGRLPERLDRHRRTRRRELLEVARDLRPVRQLPVRAHAIAEHRFGRRNPLRKNARGGKRSRHERQCNNEGETKASATCSRPARRHGAISSLDVFASSSRPRAT